MNKIIAALLFSILAMPFLTIGCRKEYSEVKKIDEEYIALMEDYVDEIEKVENAKDAAIAINWFTDSMKKLLPRMQEIAEKYPEIKDLTNLPKDLKENHKRMQEAGRKMTEAIEIRPYQPEDAQAMVDIFYQTIQPR